MKSSEWQGAIEGDWEHPSSSTVSRPIVGSDDSYDLVSWFFRLFCLDSFNKLEKPVY